MNLDVKIGRVDAESKILKLLESQWTGEKIGGCGVLITSEGGTGKTTALGIIRSILKSKENTNVGRIYDLKSPIYWDFNKLLTDICKELFPVEDQEQFSLLSVYHKLNKLKKFSYSSRKVNILMFDTAEGSAGTTKAQLYSGLISNLSNTVSIVASRPDSSYIADQLTDVSNVEVHELGGFSRKEAGDYIKKTQVKLSEADSDELISLCSDLSGTVNPLYLSLTCQYVAAAKFGDLKGLNPKISKSDNRTFRRTVLNSYLSSAKLPLWLAVVPFPIYQELYERIDAFIVEEDKLPSKTSWEEIQDKTWIRVGQNSITLHDQISQEINDLKFINDTYLDKSKLKEELLLKLREFCKDDLDNLSATLITDFVNIVSSPPQEIAKAIESINHSITSENNLFVQPRIINLLNLVCRDKADKKSSLYTLYIYDDTFDVFENSLESILKTSELLSKACQNKLLSFDVYRDFYAYFHDFEIISKADQLELVTRFTNTAISSRNIDGEFIKGKLNLRLSLAETLNDKVRAYNVFGLYYRYLNDLKNAEVFYKKSIDLLFDETDNFIKRNIDPSTVARAFNNIVSISSPGNTSHDSLFIIGRATKFFDIDDSTPPSTYIDHYRQKSRIYSRLHNTSVALKFCDEALGKIDQSFSFERIEINLRKIELLMLGSVEGEYTYDSQQISSDLEDYKSMVPVDDRIYPKIINTLGMRNFYDYLLNPSSTNSLKSAYDYFSSGIDISRVNRNLTTEIEFVLNLSTISLLSRKEGLDFDYKDTTNYINSTLALTIKTLGFEDYHEQLMIHKAHWILVSSSSNISLEIIESSLNIYKLHTLSILRSDAGSQDVNGMPAGYVAWKAAFSILSKENTGYILSKLIETFSEKGKHTVSEGVDYRASLVSMLISIKLFDSSYDPGVQNMNHRAQGFLSSAENHIREGRLKDARSVATEAILASTQNLCIETLSKSQLQLAYVDALLGNHHDSLSLAYVGLEQGIIANKFNIVSNDFLSECYRLHAEIYRYSHNFSVAWASYQSAVENVYKDNLHLQCHLIQEMAICASQATLENETLVTNESSSFEQNPIRLIDTAIEKIENNFGKDHRLLPMSYFRKGLLLNSKNYREDSVEYYRRSIDQGWNHLNEKAILFSSLALILDSIRLIKESTYEPKKEMGALIDFCNSNLTLKDVLYYSSDDCQEQVHKYTRHPSLNAQLHLSYAILKFLACRQSKKDHGLLDLIDGISIHSPRVFESPLSTIGTDGTPLGYSLWVNSISSLSDDMVSAIIAQVRDRWSSPESNVSISSWAFLSEIGLCAHEQDLDSSNSENRYDLYS